MKKETLDYIKKELEKLIPVIKAFDEAFEMNNNLLLTVRVTIQNMSFKREGCFGYSHKDDLERFNKYYNFLMVLKQSSFTYHFLDFILEEVEMIVEGNKMSELLEDEELSQMNWDEDESDKALQ